MRTCVFDFPIEAFAVADDLILDVQSFELGNHLMPRWTGKAQKL